LHVRDVSVAYPVFDLRSRRLLGQEGIHRITGGLMRPAGRSHVVVQALSHVNLSLSAGDRLGLIGHNGAGKSTLLRVMAGALFPSTGSVSSAGVIGPMFNISLGMEMDATGIENIRMMSGYYNIAPDEIDELIPRIAEFSELGDYLHAAVRTYSSGMMLRLAFAIATAKQPDVVLFDEIIGAGDASFHEKAQERLDQFLESTRILVLASHSDDLIRNFCNRAVVLERGQVVFQGPVEEAIACYHSRVDEQHADIETAKAMPIQTIAVPDGTVLDRAVAAWASRVARLVPAPLHQLLLGLPPIRRVHTFIMRRMMDGPARPASAAVAKPAMSSVLRRLYQIARHDT
ncbi:MAG: ABC transporter ATP-binding protein, partial [Alphaproteobacteria bacterium]|nr:ABC transporter ATP-binding protein [Alphaproteobacteria bacterium]